MLGYISYIFWISIILVIYTFVGYGIILLILVKIKGLFKVKQRKITKTSPGITLLIAAFNEEEFITKKIENSLQLDFPKDKIQFLFITDGSSDKTPIIIREYPQIRLMHLPERQGKTSAIERAMPEATGEIVVFSDANALLNQEALKNIIRHFDDERVGVVAGEKRILQRNVEEATGAGEGFYWKYESKLKQWDYELYSVMGAAGELFAIRKRLFEPMPRDIIIEDFYLSFKIVQKGFKIAYEPNAYAIEEPSASIKEELKRKARIAAGGIQAIVRLKELLNPFKYGVVTFQYISHRVLRWTFAPLGLLFILVTNIVLLSQGWVYQLLFACQVLFYLLAFAGFFFEKKRIRIKLVFIPYYFCMMNYAVYLGFIRFMKGSQSVVWEKSTRRKHQ